MGKVADKFKKINARCASCDKGVTSGNNRPHSLHKTKKIIKPNLQKINGILVCTSCLRSANK